jgi:hypothetical protein
MLAARPTTGARKKAERQPCAAHLSSDLDRGRRGSILLWGLSAARRQRRAPQGQIGNLEGMRVRERTGAALRPGPSRLFYSLFDSSYLRISVVKV